MTIKNRGRKAIKEEKVLKRNVRSGTARTGALQAQVATCSKKGREDLGGGKKERKGSPRLGEAILGCALHLKTGHAQLLTGIPV